MAERLTDLPNVGATCAARLQSAGITTPEELAAAGSVNAALRIRAVEGDEGPCRSLLAGLEGAIRGIRWHDIPKADRDRLWREYRRQAEEG
ncbi:MAG: TfoX/Sxy family protein [Candidatus Eisenbacteria bacterium]|jgi:DNA transformation protein|nr:TfoX/Sxy family protein [Candidatus Eisenbacteria bacterium]